MHHLFETVQTNGLEKESFACPPDLQKNGRRVEVSAAVEQISCFATSSTVAVTLSVLARLRCLYKGILQPQGWRVWSGSCGVVCIFCSYIYRISTILLANSQVLPTKSWKSTHDSKWKGRKLLRRLQPQGKTQSWEAVLLRPEAQGRSSRLWNLASGCHWNSGCSLIICELW